MTSQSPSTKPLVLMIPVLLCPPSGNNEDAAMVDNLSEGLLPLAVFGSSSSSSSSSSSQKMVIEVSSPQDGMVLGVVLVSFAILDLAAGLLGGLLKLLYH
ncbi:hypothetical protein O3P69_000689 [Scylla paramamosain]|uniref:Uncharacterized protein n=1 Tax=Scylla paramamosain TaxID=85552 RepID=A0AAW0UUR7_SCYPA